MRNWGQNPVFAPLTIHNKVQPQQIWDFCRSLVLASAVLKNAFWHRTSILDFFSSSHFSRCSCATKGSLQGQFGEEEWLRRAITLSEVHVIVVLRHLNLSFKAAPINNVISTMAKMWKVLFLVINPQRIIPWLCIFQLIVLVLIQQIITLWFSLTNLISSSCFF